KKSKQGLILSIFGFFDFGNFLRCVLLGFKSCLPLFSSFVFCGVHFEVRNFSLTYEHSFCCGRIVSDLSVFQ
ncbi:hypothetical protein VIGAN_04287200, partial [Vigna angularis var. angularis]